MALQILALLVALGSLAAITNWRRGLFAMVVLATCQDPLRKLVPEAPGYLVLATAPIVLASALQMMMSQPAWWASFRALYPAVGRSVMWLGLAAVPAAFISGTYGAGSWMFTLLGAASYGILILSIVMGFHFVQSLEQIRRFMAFYVIVTSVMLSGGFVEYLDLSGGSQLIGTQALGMTWIRHIPGVIVELVAGFYRSPDVMGWHAATTVMFTLLLAITAPRPLARLMWGLLGVYAFAALMLCGRRKMVFMVPLFLLICAWLYWMVGKRGSLGSLIGVLLFPLVSVGFVGDFMGDDSTHVTYYVEGVVDTIDQVETHSLVSVVGTYLQTGFFGHGLGFSTPGAQNIPAERPRSWQESAPTRIMAELGVPGMCALLFLVIRLLMAAWSVVRGHLQQSHDALALYVMGFAAYFLVNVGSLAVSGQILGDPFVAMFLGMSIGFVLAFGKGFTGAPVQWPMTEMRHTSQFDGFEPTHIQPRLNTPTRRGQR
jgi:hypothetical protein